MPPTPEAFLPEDPVAGNQEGMTVMEDAIMDMVQPDSFRALVAGFTEEQLLGATCFDGWDLLSGCCAFGMTKFLDILLTRCPRMVKAAKMGRPPLW